jgi:hypothetical protein
VTYTVAVRTRPSMWVHMTHMHPLPRGNDDYSSIGSSERQCVFSSVVGGCGVHVQSSGRSEEKLWVAALL